MALTPVGNRSLPVPTMAWIIKDGVDVHSCMPVRSSTFSDGIVLPIQVPVLVEYSPSACSLQGLVIERVFGSAFWGGQTLIEDYRQDFGGLRA